MEMRQHRLPWQVLLIGGSSGVGKTAAARQLAQQLSITLVLADDVRLALQRVTTSTSHPALHIFLGYRLEHWRVAEKVRDDWIAVGQAMRPALQAIIEHHVAVPSAGQLILEGDTILPSLRQPGTYSDPIRAMLADALRSVFIVEQDQTQLLNNLRSRGRGFETWGSLEQESFARASWLFGEWLSQEARGYGISVIASQPLTTLTERILQVIV